jgi:2-oxoglutarate decarboxylase
VPQSSGNQSPEQPSADFGANEWLVEEMYDQYQKDPGSVDPTWAKYFQANGGANGAVSTPEKSEQKSEKPSQQAATKTAEKPAPKTAERPA